MDVFRNGIRLNSADFTASTGTTVVLTSGATAGDTVTTESFYVSSVVGAIPATAGAVNTSYITDGAVTQAKLGTGVASNGPLMYVAMSTTQSISAGTQSVINFDTKTYDTANCFNTTTHRFTPNVAGYYQVNLVVYLSGASGANEIQSAIQKNGADYMYPIDMVATNIWSSGGSTIVYCNGTTDYITGAFYCAATKTISNVWTFMSAAMIRSA
jgi:hypothetical protein